VEPKPKVPSSDGSSSSKGSMKTNLQFVTEKGTNTNTKPYDIIDYGKKAPGLENHHGVLDVWTSNNILGNGWWLLP
jgi:hypothetical protein